MSTGSNYGDWLNILFGKSSMIRLWFDLNFYKKIFSYFIIQHLNPLTFLLAINGIIISLKTKDWVNKFHINWILGNILFLFIFSGANIGHPYYQIYFTPPLLFFVGLFISKFSKSISNKNILINICLVLNLLISLPILPMEVTIILEFQI